MGDTGFVPLAKDGGPAWRQDGADCPDRRQAGDDPAQRRPRQLWLKKVLSGTCGFSTAGATSTCAGESRKTLLVTFSIAPCRPNTRPAAKSTSRLASASAMSPRFMITGIPERKA